MIRDNNKLPDLTDKMLIEVSIWTGYLSKEDTEKISTELAHRLEDRNTKIEKFRRILSNQHNYHGNIQTFNTLFPPDQKEKKS